MTGAFVQVGPIWAPVGHMGYKWPARSVERLPPFRRQKLRNQILVIGNTGDPVTPIASARFVAGLLGDQAVLVEQLGFGHTTLAELSNCTDKVVADHVMRGIVSLFHLGVSISSQVGSLDRMNVQLPREEETKCEVDSRLGRLSALFSLEDEDVVPQFVVQRP